MPKKEHQHDHDCAHGHSLEHAFEQMKAAGLKRTKAREAILACLVENHGPFSAKELQEALKSRKKNRKGSQAISDLDTVTTYRCLASFEEANLVRRCDFGDGIARFELRGGEHHHHHVLCTRCRKIEKLDDCHLEKLEARVRALGYSEVRHVLEFSGLCRACAAS